MVAKKKTAAKRKTAAKKAVRAPAVPATGGWWKNSFSNSGILIAIGALLGIIAFVCGWLRVGYNDGGVNIAIVFSGFNLITLDETMKELFDGQWQVWIPLFTMIASIFAFLAIILPAFGLRVGNLGIDIIVIVVGIVMFILAICFLFGQTKYGYLDPNPMKFINYLDVGCYLTIVSSVLMILGGLRDATKH